MPHNSWHSSRKNPW